MLPRSQTKDKQKTNKQISFQSPIGQFHNGGKTTFIADNIALILCELSLRNPKSSIMYFGLIIQIENLQGLLFLSFAISAIAYLSRLGYVESTTSQTL